MFLFLASFTADAHCYPLFTICQHTACVCVCMFMYVCMYVHMCVYLYVCMYLYVMYVLVCNIMYVCNLCVCVLIYVCIHAPAHKHARTLQSPNVTRCGLDGPGIESHCGQDFPCRPDRLRGPPNRCTMGIGSFPAVKWPERGVYRPYTSSAELRNDWSCISASPVCLHGPVMG